jgi:hypothetical protein
MMAEKIPTKVSMFKRLVAVVVIAPFFFGLVVFFMGRWLAYPTKFLAHENIVVRLDCLSKKTWGKSSRGLVMIDGVRQDNMEHVELPWPAKQVPECPRTITIVGKVWFFGIYVTELRT